MKKLTTFIAVLLLLVSPVIIFAQDGYEKSGLGNTMRSNGRIYVVIVVMLTILAGLIFYLARLDRKIGKLEKETN
jgi:hypothetical protein